MVRPLSPGGLVIPIRPMPPDRAVDQPGHTLHPLGVHGAVVPIGLGDRLIAARPPHRLLHHHLRPRKRLMILST